MIYPAIKLFDDLVKHQTGCQDGTHYLIRCHSWRLNVGGATRAVLRVVLGAHRIIHCFETVAAVDHDRLAPSTTLTCANRAANR